jgi:hypothetical protein
VLIFDHNGLGPLEGQKRQSVVETGTYYRIRTRNRVRDRNGNGMRFSVRNRARFRTRLRASSPVLTKGEFFLEGEKTGTLEFNDQGLLVKKTVLTSHFDLPKEETVIEYEYSSGLLVRATISLNGQVIQEWRMTYSDYGRVSKAVVRNNSVIIDERHESKPGSESTMQISYVHEPQVLTRTYRFFNAPGELVEKIHFVPTQSTQKLGLMDPLIFFDQFMYHEKKLYIARKDFYLDGEDVTGDRRKIEMFYSNKGQR